MNLLLVLISAAFYVLSFPLWGAGFLAFFALVPLFMAVERARSTARGMACGIAWGAFMSTGLGYWLFPTLTDHFNVWPPKAVLFFLLCVVLPSCLIYGGVFLVYRFVHHAHLAWYALVLPAIWTLAEYLKEMVPFLLPWGAVGYAVLPFQRFVQIADVAGVHGLTFLVVMINAMLCFMWRRTRQKKHYYGRSLINSKPIFRKKKPMTSAGPLLMLALAICIPVIYGTLRIYGIEKEINRKKADLSAIQAVLVQGNFSLHERWSGMGFYQRLQTYLDMSISGTEAGRSPTQAEDDKTEASGKEEERADGNGNRAQAPMGETAGHRVIVWPETTLNAPGLLSDDLFRQIMDMIGDDALLIAGGLKQDDASGRVMNSAYLVSDNGMLTRYDKNILLPYGETTMMVDWLGQYYTAPSEFAPGQTPSCIDTPYGRVGVSICFEILYPRYIARSVASGADFIVNISNDGWFGDSAMPHMHLNAARMRAIENRRFLLRAANNGISAIISPDGRIVTRTDLFQRQRIDGDFVYLDIAAPYTRFGDWLIIFSAAILAISLLAIFLRKD